MCTFVHGFEAYFYIEKPRNWSREEVESLMLTLNVSVSHYAYKGGTLPGEFALWGFTYNADSMARYLHTVPVFSMRKGVGRDGYKDRFAFLRSPTK